MVGPEGIGASKIADCNFIGRPFVQLSGLIGPFPRYSLGAGLSSNPNPSILVKLVGAIGFGASKIADCNFIGRPFVPLSGLVGPFSPVGRRGTLFESSPLYPYKTGGRNRIRTYDLHNVSVAR